MQCTTALQAEIKVEAVLLYTGGATYKKTAAHLGIGPSTESFSVNVISRAIASNYNDKVYLPTKEEVSRAVQGFQKLNGVPYCVGATDGTHIKWPIGPEDQYYESGCYKGYPSNVLVAHVNANIQFMYLNIGKPGVLEYYTMYDQSTLKTDIENGR